MPADFELEYPAKYGFLKEKSKEIYGNSEMFDTLLYCGEYGVIDKADIESTLRWYKDIQEVLKRHNIGHALWSYRDMDFGFTDERMNSVRTEIINSGKI